MTELCRTKPIVGIAFRRVGQPLVTVSEDEMIRMWDLAKRSELGSVSLPGSTNRVLSVDITSDGAQFLVSSSDGMVRLYEGLKMVEVACLQEHTGEVTCAVYAPDESRILSGGQDGLALLWDRTKGTVLWRFKGHTEGVTCAAFALDGLRALTGSEDGTARVWDCVTGKELFCLLRQRGGVRCVSFAPDGRLAVVCDQHGWVTFWDLEPGTKGKLVGLYVARYVVGAVFWEDGQNLCLADLGGPDGRPHVHKLRLEGMGGG
jgi:WD40 repeat protein